MGKLPCRGDFIHHNLSASDFDSWHQWCQAGMAVSREQLKENWLDAWLTAPIWIFAITASDNFGKNKVGAWMPSIDAAGRHFPFIVVTEHTGDAWSSIRRSTWANPLKDHMLKVFDDNWDETSWQSALEEIMPPSSEPDLLSIENSGDSKGWTFTPEISDSCLLANLLHSTGKHMFWQNSGSAFVKASTMITPGLLSASQFSALICTESGNPRFNQISLPAHEEIPCT